MSEPVENTSKRPVQTFINGPGEHMPPTRTTCPEPHFRIKGGVLQQLHSSAGGGRGWWINVPTVEEDELDAIFR